MMGSFFARRNKKRNKKRKENTICKTITRVYPCEQPGLHYKRVGTSSNSSTIHSLLNRLVEALSRPALSHRLFSRLWKTALFRWSISLWERLQGRGWGCHDDSNLTNCVPLLDCGFNWISLRKNKNAVESSDMNAMKLSVWLSCLS